MDAPHVRTGLKDNHDMLNKLTMGQAGPMPSSIPAKQPGEVYPLAGSCACCQRDETGGGAVDLKKCSKCKLTRCVTRRTSWQRLGEGIR